MGFVPPTNDWAHRFDVFGDEILFLKVTKPMLIEWPEWDCFIYWDSLGKHPQVSYIQLDKYVRIYRFVPDTRNTKGYDVRLRRSLFSHAYSIEILTGLKAEIANAQFKEQTIMHEYGNTSYSGGPSDGDRVTQ